MSQPSISVDGARRVLAKYVKRESLMRHSLAVEAAMRHFAVMFGEDPDLWGIIGMLHDLDYELYPDQHCLKTPELLAKEGLPAEWGRSITTHGWKICTDAEPQTDMEKVLYTVDQLTGLIAATAAVRPSRSLDDLTAKSVKKKWKDKAFAANIDREVIARGMDMLLPLTRDEIITETITAMRSLRSLRDG